jgi:hypothetical protein
MTDATDATDAMDTTDTGALAERLRGHLDAEDAPAHLRHYLTPGAFAGAYFDTLGGRGDAKKVANRFTMEDLVATSTLGRPVRGWAVIELLETRRKRWSALLGDLPRKRALHKASDDELEALARLEAELATVSGIGPVTSSRLLARKRPTLVSVAEPAVVEALTGHRRGEFTRPLRDAMREEGVVPRLKEIRDAGDADHLSLVRILDIVVWMRSGGARASRLPDRPVPSEG